MTQGTLVGSGATAEVFEWNDDSDQRPKVLKLFKPGVPPDAIEQERQASRAVSKTTLPAARFYGEIVDEASRVGFIFDRIEGPTLARCCEVSPWRLVAYARHLADLHLRVHHTKMTGLVSVKQRLRNSIPGTRSLTEGERSHLMAMVEALPDGDHLCHGDFHPENIIYREHEKGGLVIIDWMNASVGDPLADVARTRVLLTVGLTVGKNPLDRVLARLGAGLLYFLYRQRYFANSGADRSGVEAWMPLIASAHIGDLEMIEEAGGNSYKIEIANLAKFVRRKLHAGATRDPDAEEGKVRRF